MAILYTVDNFSRALENMMISIDQLVLRHTFPEQLQYFKFLEAWTLVRPHSGGNPIRVGTSVTPQGYIFAHLGWFGVVKKDGCFCSLAQLKDRESLMHLLDDPCSNWRNAGHSKATPVFSWNISWESDLGFWVPGASGCIIACCECPPILLFWGLLMMFWACGAVATAINVRRKSGFSKGDGLENDGPWYSGNLRFCLLDDNLAPLQL